MKIRLAKTWRKKVYTYKIVLVEHSKPAKTGFIKELGWLNAETNDIKYDEEQIKKYISNGAKPTPRVARELYQDTEDDFYLQFMPNHKSK